jgi:hypothetical protein
MFSYLNVMHAYAGWNIGPWKAQSTKFITPDCDKKLWMMKNVLTEIPTSNRS